MKRRYKYAFTKKDETEGGFASVVFAVCSLILFLAASCISFMWEGNAESWIGAFGVMAILFSICGFYIGIKSFQEKDKNYRLSVLGAMANGICVVGWLALFLMGV